MSLVAVVAVALAYEWLSLRAGRWSRWRGAAFMGGCMTLLIGLAMHAHDLPVHMTQHLLVGMVAPIGLVLGAPMTLLLRNLRPASGRRLTGLLRTWPVRLVTRPVVTLLLGAGSLLLLHLTPLYAYAMSDPALHTAVLAHFLASGCLFTWVVAGPDPAPHRPPVRTRLVVLGVAIAAHATLAQLLYAGALVQVPGTDADRQTAATILYYGGDLAELLLAFAVVQTRGAPRRRTSGSWADKAAWPARVSAWPRRVRDAGHCRDMVVLDSAAELVAPLRRRAARVAPWFGPAFVAAIAYADPGNFATNFSGGAMFGYQLVWVIVAANLMAMLIQSLSAKLGLVTGRDLPELCREHLPRPVTRGLWVQAELVAMATDLAEIIGGALALNLLFGVPLPVGGLITCVVAFALLALQQRGVRRFETVIAGLLGVILLGFLYDALRAGTDVATLGAGMVPSFSGTDSLLLATGILGATVMPHVIYLHSALTKSRSPASAEPAQRRTALRYQRVDTLVALGLAGLVNLAMLLIAARLFYGSGIPGTDTLEGIHAGLGITLDKYAALAFAIALLASGFASSSVGTYAGQVVMQGFIGRTIPLTCAGC